MPLIARAQESDTKSPVGTPPTADRPSRDEIARWLGVLVAPEGCVELRAVGVTRKGQPGTHAESTFFAPTETEAMARAALALSGRAEGVYWTLNPVHANCYLSPAGKGATKGDILRRRWLLVDCDPVRPADVSATDAEKAASLDTAQTIRNFLRMEAWPEPVLADSGNGYHLLYRIDLPNDDESKTLVRSCLKTLAAEFDSDLVKIDTSVHDAPRICKLYGTLARKGEPTAERPHRPSRIIDLPATVEVVAVEWLEALARSTGPEVGAAATIPIRPGLVAKAQPVRTTDPVRSYALAALNAEVQRVAQAAPGERNATLNAAAFAIGQIVGAGAINEAEAITTLTMAGLMAGPNEAKIRDTALRGIAAGKLDPRDLSTVGQAGNGGGPIAGVIAAADPGPNDPANEGDDDPHRLGRVYLDGECQHPDGPRLRYWLERWHRWDGAAWRTVPDAEVAAELTRSIKREFNRLVRGTTKAPKPVTTKSVSNSVQALKALTLLTHRECPRQPAWLDVAGPDPVECVVARNGILHLPAFIAGEASLIPPTPRLFIPNALHYEFRADAPKPVRWFQFLHDLWDNDQPSIECLQEWFGYLLTPDTRQSKMLMLIGPTRSGKGTICQVLESLVGSANVAAPTLSGLATNFGIAPLIGKSVAIIPDARLSGRSDAQVIIERLISISGRDPQTIDRKHREDWTGHLTTRFVIGSNELPRLGDSSGALAGRIMLLRLTRTFFGRENVDLADQLQEELPGILLWSIAGWQRLRERRRFHQPPSGQELLDEFADLSSPIQAFLSDRCVTGSEVRIAVQDLYTAWKTWCTENGRDHPGDVAGFGRSLRSALPTLSTSQPRRGDKRVRMFVGVSLKDSADPAF